MDYNQLYKSMHDFLKLNGDSNMVLSKAAAIDMCQHAMDYDILIWRVEGGVWCNPGFQACGDAIWDGIDPPASKEEAIENNGHAVTFLKKYQPIKCDVCILTIVNYQNLPDEHLYDKYFEKHSISS